MTCLDCGTELTGEQKVCGHCGAASLPPERRTYIYQMANAEWVDEVDPIHYDDDAYMEKLEAEWDAKALDFCRTNANPYELHAFVTALNWDSGLDILLEIIKNPACDLGTAQRIFWLAQPSFYQPFQGKDDVHPISQDGWDFIQNVMKLSAEKRFRSHAIHYDPSMDHEAPLDPAEARWAIPELFFKQPTNI